MCDETKDDSSGSLYWDESLEVISMGKKKFCPQNARILRKKWNHRRSVSEQVPPRPAIIGSTLTQLIGEHTDSSDSTVYEGSLKIVDSPKSTQTSFSSSSGLNDVNDEYKLRNRNNDLMVTLTKQRNQIHRLESKIEALVNTLKDKEEDVKCALVNNAFSEKRLQQMATLQSDKWKLTLEVDALRQIVREQADTLEKVNLEGQLVCVRESSTKVISNTLDDTNDIDVYANTLQQKVNELTRVVLEKDNEIKDLMQLLHSQDLGVMEFKKKLDAKCRSHTNVASKLEAAYRETDKLRHTTKTLQDSLETSNNQLKAVEQRLNAEKEATRILQVEQEGVIKKYETLAKEEASNDVPFMYHYDEDAHIANVQYSEVGSEDSNSVVSQVDHFLDVGVGGYYLGDEDIPKRRRKSKPTRAPPPLPNQQFIKSNARKMKEQSVSQSEKTKRLNQADYEYFLMSSIAVRMNLAAVYGKDEIMAVDSGKLWEVSRISQIPMNEYYSYIDNALRKEFNLQKLPYSKSTLEQRALNTHCCIVM